MSYVLDTNTVSALMKSVPSAAARMQETHRADVAISQLTVAETEFGLRDLPASKRRRVLAAQWRSIGAELIRLVWDDDVSRVFGERKDRLPRSDIPMSDFDLAVAAPASAAPERSPRAYTPKHLADETLQSKSALEGERKHVTVLFADVKSSMELAEQLGPEGWHAILDTCTASRTR